MGIIRDIVAAMDKAEMEEFHTKAANDHTIGNSHYVSKMMHFITNHIGTSSHSMLIEQIIQTEYKKDINNMANLTNEEQEGVKIILFYQNLVDTPSSEGEALSLWRLMSAEKKKSIKEAYQKMNKK